MSSKIKWKLTELLGQHYADIKSGRAYICKRPGAKQRPWELRMPGSNGYRYHFQANFRKLADAKLVVSLLND